MEEATKYEELNEGKEVVKDGAYYRATLPPMCSVEQARMIPNVSARSITRMCRDGEIKAVKVRGVWRVNRDALISYCGL